MDAGRVLATETPRALIEQRGAETLEEAFISYLEEHARRRSTEAPQEPLRAPLLRKAKRAEDQLSFSPGGFFAYAIRESLELLRDPIRLAFAFAGSALLMLIFGFGISTDVDNLTFAVLDRDQTPESRAYIRGIRGRAISPRRPRSGTTPISNGASRWRDQGRNRNPSGFGRDIKHTRPVWVGAWIDGAMPFRAETIRGYIQGTHQKFVSDLEAVRQVKATPLPAARVETRFLYNQDFESIYAMVPSTLSLLLALIPAILMALAIVREKELGSITNLYVTPVKRSSSCSASRCPISALPWSISA